MTENERNSAARDGNTDAGRASHVPELHSLDDVVAELGIEEDRCGHCQEPDRGVFVSGYATVNGQFLCHPDEGMDCYRLVTVHGHTMPCYCHEGQ